jgi:sugar transferase (PEP-CTERM system associated)
VSAWARRVAAPSLALAVFENVLIVGAVLISVRIRLGPTGWTSFTLDGGYSKTILIALVVQLCLYFADLYDRRTYADLRELFLRLVQGLAAASICLAVLYFWLPYLIIGRGVFLIASALVVFVVGGWRLASYWLGHRTAPRERLLVVGTGPQSLRLSRELFERRFELGVEIVGFIDPDPPADAESIGHPNIVGGIEDIPAIARARRVTRIVVSLSDARGKLPMDTLLEMKLAGIQFDHLASVYEEYTGKISVENLRPSWLLFSDDLKHAALLGVWKRTFDVVVAFLGLVIGFPLMLLVAVVLKLTSRGPVFYHQTRVGKGGALFTVHKFRTMRPDAEAGTGAVWASPNDTRVTPVGRVLRRTRIDEMPQLWNVLKGDMSMVGPRPERPEFVAELARQIPFYGERHLIKPGVTGWAQVRYTYGASVEDALEKLQYDLFYLKNMSPVLDLLIMVDTVKTVVLRRGAA